MHLHALLCALAVAAPPQRTTSSSSDAPEAGAAQAKARGDAALVAGLPAEALKEYDFAIQLSSDPALFYNRARALQALERYPEAVRQLEKFVALATPELRARVPKLDGLLVEVRSKSSSIEVKCPIEGAEVRIGDKVVGKTPLTRRLDWNTGTVVLTVSHPDFHAFTRPIELPPAGVAVVEVALNPRATTGLLKVTANEPGATLLVDDTPRGSTPFEGYLPLGTHTIDVQAEGFDHSKNSVVISSVDARELNIELAPTPKFYQRWYFWAGVVAVVAGGTATAIALTTERPATEGTLGITAVSPAAK